MTIARTRASAPIGEPKKKPADRGTMRALKWTPTCADAHYDDLIESRGDSVSTRSSRPVGHLILDGAQGAFFSCFRIEIPKRSGAHMQ